MGGNQPLTRRATVRYKSGARIIGSFHCLPGTWIVRQAGKIIGKFPTSVLAHDYADSINLAPTPKADAQGGR